MQQDMYNVYMYMYIYICESMNMLLAYGVHNGLSLPDTSAFTQSWKRLGAKYPSCENLMNFVFKFFFYERFGVVQFRTGIKLSITPS